MSAGSESMPRLTDGYVPPMTVGEAGLGRAPFDREGFNLLAEKLLAHLATAPHDMGLLLDLSVVLQLASRREDGLIAQREALARQQVYRVCGTEGPAADPCLHMLALCGPGDLMTNTPLEFIVDHVPIRLDMLFVLPDQPLPDEIPDHDIAFVALSQSAACEPLLRRLSELKASWPRPIIQEPLRIIETSRERLYHRLHDLPGIRIAPVLRVDRSSLERVARGELSLESLEEGFRGDSEKLAFPILVRPIDSHAGRGLAKLAELADLERYLSETDEADLHVMPFIEYAKADGLYRKYRIVLIDGKPYLCHLAISDNWMLHYAHAGMSESAEKRQEEAQAMEQFDEEFGRRHAAAFRAIDERVGLPYLGIDCSETRDGELLVFEADPAMVIHAMDPPDLFPYKQVQMRKVFDAFYAMAARAARPSDPTL